MSSTRATIAGEANDDMMAVKVAMVTWFSETKSGIYPPMICQLCIYVCNVHDMTHTRSNNNLYS